MKSFSSLFQFLLGFFLGIALLVGGSAALGYFVFTRLATNPEKPLFAEEKKPTQPVSDTKTTDKPNTDTKAVDTSTTTTEKSESQDESLPSGSYRARVTWPQGLSLRAEPSINATRIGGVGYNGRVLILDTNNDGQWQRVRVGQQEGWIKAGNVEKVDE